MYFILLCAIGFCVTLYELRVIAVLSNTSTYLVIKTCQLQQNIEIFVIVIIRTVRCPIKKK